MLRSSRFGIFSSIEAMTCTTSEAFLVLLIPVSKKRERLSTKVTIYNLWQLLYLRNVLIDCAFLPIEDALQYPGEYKPSPVFLFSLSNWLHITDLKSAVDGTVTDHLISML